MHCICPYSLVFGSAITIQNALHFLDLQEGEFVKEQPGHPHFLDDKQAFVTSQLLRVQQPDELEDIKLNHDFRRNLLFAI